MIKTSILLISLVATCNLGQSDAKLDNCPADRRKSRCIERILIPNGPPIVVAVNQLVTDKLSAISK